MVSIPLDVHDTVVQLVANNHPFYCNKVINIKSHLQVLFVAFHDEMDSDKYGDYNETSDYQTDHCNKYVLPGHFAGLDTWALQQIYMQNIGLPKKRFWNRKKISLCWNEQAERLNFASASRLRR